MPELLDGATEVDGVRHVYVNGTYGRYAPRYGPRQWHRMNFDDWVWMKRNPNDRTNFIAGMVLKLEKAGLKLAWTTPRYVKEPNGNRWVYWKAVRVE